MNMDGGAVALHKKIVTKCSNTAYFLQESDVSVQSIINIHLSLLHYRKQAILHVILLNKTTKQSCPGNDLFAGVSLRTICQQADSDVIV